MRMLHFCYMDSRSTACTAVSSAVATITTTTTGNAAYRMGVAVHEPLSEKLNKKRLLRNVGELADLFGARKNNQG